MMKKIGIFGGSFNPAHAGHVEAVRSVSLKTGLNEVLVIPTAQNPLKPAVEGPTPDERLAMAELAFKGEGLPTRIDDREIRRGGRSYSIDTVAELKKENPGAEFHFILGVELLEDLNQWKSWEKLIGECNFIFVSRPGFELPSEVSELPSFLTPFVDEFEFNYVQLKTGKTMQFVRIGEVAVSSTELRKWLRIGKKTSQFIPLAVETYIREKGLYRPVSEKIADFGAFAKFCAQALNEKKGINLRGFDLRQLAAPAEFAVVGSGTSTRHTSSLGENLMRTVKEEYNVFPQGVEGIEEGRWVVIDYGSVMVHLFYDFVRQDYKIEDLWRQAAEMKLELSASPKA